MKKILLTLLLLSPLLSHSNYIVLFTLPKSGTNLALKCLKLIYGPKTTHQNISSIDINQVNNDIPKLYWGHEWKFIQDLQGSLSPNTHKTNFLQNLNAKVLLLLRDPRQHVVSLLRATNRAINSDNIAYAINNFPKLLRDQTGQNCFLQYYDINECYQEYLKWQKEYQNTYTIRFEHLIGPNGRRNLLAQKREINNLAIFLNISLDELRVNKIAEKVYGKTHTFREGKIDTWKNHFSKENKQLFKNVAGDLLIKLGYEKNSEW